MDVVAQKIREFLSRFFSSLLGKLILVFVIFGAISAGSGVVAHFGIGQFSSFGEAVWWSFLHMSDTGYLGDDKGDSLRVLAVVVTLLGALLVLVFLITILATELNKMVHSMALSYRPVKATGHLVCIGWNERVPEMLGRLVESSGRMQARFGDRGPKIFAVLAPKRMLDQREDLLDQLRKQCGYMTPRMPFGNALSDADFDLVSAGTARVVMIPARSRLNVDPNIADVANIKIGLSLDDHFGRKAGDGRTVTIEFHSRLNLEAARSVLPDWYNLLASDQMAAQIISPSLMHPGVGATLYQLFGGGGGGYGLYLIKEKAFVGKRFRDLIYDFRQAVPIGLFTGTAGHSETRLAVPPDTAVGADDEIILVAQDLNRASVTVAEAADADADGGELILAAPRPRPSRVLAIGWSSRIVELVDELRSQTPAELELTSLSVKPAAERQAILRQVAHDELKLNFIDASPTDPAALADAVSAYAPEAIVVMSSEVVGDARRADAQALICHLHLERIVADDETPIVVELFYPEDAKGFPTRSTTDILATDSMLGYFLSQVALRPEVADIYEAFLGASGPHLVVAKMASQSKDLSFAGAYQTLLAKGDVLIGYMDQHRLPHLVPEDHVMLPENCELMLIRGRL